MSEYPAAVRVALVLGPSTGGIGRHVASVARGLAGRGHRVLVFAPTLTRDSHPLAAPGVTVRPLTALTALRQVDLIHAHGYQAAARALPIARLQGIPLVTTWHNAILSRGPAGAGGRLLQRLVARGSDLTLGASSDLVAEALRLGARAAVLAPVAAPALPPPACSPRDRRTGLGVGPDDVVVLSVTRLAPQKNLGLLLDLAATVWPLPTGRWRFAVVGDGPMRAELAARIRRAELPVTLLGASGDVASWYAAADLVLLTSTWEARSLVAQEALLSGTPLVATRVGGLPELVGEAALLFDPAEPAQGRRALGRLARDRTARERLAQAGRRQAATWPDEVAVVDDLLRHYREVISTHAQLARPARPRPRRRLG